MHFVSILSYHTMALLKRAKTICDRDTERKMAHLFSPSEMAHFGSIHVISNRWKYLKLNKIVSRYYIKPLSIESCTAFDPFEVTPCYYTYF